MRIVANGISINYEVAGSGKCIVLIHGMGDNLGAWYNQVPVFSQRYRVLSYDVRGHGETEAPEGEFSTDIWTEDLHGLLEAVGINKAYVLGYSMGGIVALNFALRYPEMVEALILANSGGARPPVMSEQEMREAMERRRIILERVEKEGLAATMDESTAMMFSPGFPERNREAYERYKAVRLRNDPQNYLRLMRSMGTMFRGAPPDLSKIRCPTLIIGGEFDGLMGAEGAKATQQAIAGSQLKIMLTGHASAIEQPEEFNNAVMGFLARLG